jgi:hypothetical protein
MLGGVLPLTVDMLSLLPVVQDAPNSSAIDQGVIPTFVTIVSKNGIRIKRVEMQQELNDPWVGMTVGMHLFQGIQRILTSNPVPLVKFS